MVGQKISVTVTDEEGNEATSDETALVSSDLSLEVALVDESGLQADGTALVGDTLGITYGAEFGTVSAITWYVNGAVKQVSSVDGTGVRLQQTTDRGYIGEVYAIVENTNKDRAKTNTITVTDVEQPIEVSDVAIINDYDTPTISYAAADADAVMTVTMSKAVDGDLYIYKESTTKYGNGNNFAKIAAADFADTYTVDKASQLTAKNAVAYAGYYNGINFRNADGSTTYMLKVGDNNMTNKFSPVRGTTYKAVFDQEAISTDNIGATTRADVTVSDPFAAPYVIAPESIALTSHSAGSVPQITLYDAAGEVLTWLANPADDEVEAYGISNVTTYGETGSTKAKAKKTAQGITDGDSGIEKGVITGDTVLNAGSSYFWATVTTEKGIFGAKAVTLESDIVEGTESPYATMNIVDDSTNPHDAVVTFTKLKTPGTVYVIQGGNGVADTAVASFDADDVATYVGKARVEKGDTKVVISDAIESFADSSAANRYYTALFVPENTEDYAKAYPTTYDNTKQSVKDAEKSNNLVVAQIPTSIAFDEEGAADTAEITGQGLDKEADISDVISGGKIKAYDQFGDLMQSAAAAKTATVTVKNNTLATTEDANAQYEIEADGSVTVNLYRDQPVDPGDGFDVTILGSKVSITNKSGEIINKTAATTGWEVKLGSDTVVAAPDSALGTAVFTFDTFTSQIDTSTTAIATFTGALATGADVDLESSLDGTTWAKEEDCSLLGTDSFVTDNDVTLAADTYYRLKVTATGFATAFVTMDGGKTAAAVATGIGTTAGTALTTGTGTVADLDATTAGAIAFGATYKVFDQFDTFMTAAGTATFTKGNSDATATLTWADGGALAGTYTNNGNAGTETLTAYGCVITISEAAP